MQGTESGGATTSDLGRQMHGLIEELYPICRSISGNGVRETLRRIGDVIPLQVHEVPSGTQIFDWTVPREWNVNDAYVKNSRGERVIDFQRSNLHLVSYSTPIHERMPLSKLRKHLFTLPDQPDRIPYRTSYYSENWGFCLAHEQLLAFEEGEYEVCIDSCLSDGHLTYGEYLIEGASNDEVLISCHVCHPSLCNDNLAGIAVATFLARELSTSPRRYSYRFLFIPGTIGSIAWLYLNENSVHHIKHGLVLTGVGDGGHPTYKRSRRGDAEIDRTVAHVLRHRSAAHEIQDFSPYGYDERQYCSPGFNLPVGCFMRTPWGRYAEYHTSADNLEFVQPWALVDSFRLCMEVFGVLEANRSYVNLNPKGEPQLGKRGLYRAIGGESDEPVDELAMLWVLNLSDGEHSLLDIAERSACDFEVVKRAADVLVQHELLREKAT